MKPIDYSKATFEDLRSRLQGERLKVLAAWRQHGPGTTAEVAERSEISILSLRPRTTELYELGFLRLENPDARGKEGIYKAAGDSEVFEIFKRRRAAAQRKEEQVMLEI